MNAGIGTKWVAPGKGATIQKLTDAIRATYGMDSGGTLDDAWERLITLYDLDHRTNLALTGAPLSVYDLKRIAACE